jgi:hypothetical protein
MSLFDALSRVQHLLLRPTAENLDRSAPYLELVAEALRQDPNLITAGTPAEARRLAALLNRVRKLHEQAGRLRFGAARVGVAESSGYTHAGEPAAPAHRPNLAVTG